MIILFRSQQGTSAVKAPNSTRRARAMARDMARWHSQFGPCRTIVCRRGSVKAQFGLQVVGVFRHD